MEKKQRLLLSQVPEEKKSPNSKEQRQLSEQQPEERKEGPKSQRSSDSGEIKKQITPKFQESDLIDPKKMKDLIQNLDLENIPEVDQHFLAAKLKQRVADFSNSDNQSALSRLD